jgi:hypothetical protein
VVMNTAPAGDKEDGAEGGREGGGEGQSRQGSAQWRRCLRLTVATMATLAFATEGEM